MFERFAAPLRLAVKAAIDEAGRRGDTRVGTEHLLLGLLGDGTSTAADALGVDLPTARAALDRLDRHALSGVGVSLEVDVGEVPVTHAGSYSDALLGSLHGRRWFSSGAKRVLEETLHQAVAAHSREMRTEHLLLALLDRQPPDPAAALLSALGVDSDDVRGRLREAA